MEHICFEVQLWSEILIFKEKSNFWYTDHPEKSALILQSVFVLIPTCASYVCIHMVMLTLHASSKISSKNEC